MALVCLGIYLLPFGIMRLPRYDHVVGTFYGPLLEYGFSQKHVDADIVIFGDSTAIYGVDPLTVGKALGMTVVNLPNTIGSLPVTREDVLDEYLKHNRAPRLLVFYFSAWDLDYGNTPPMQVAPPFEGEDMLMRHGSPREIAGYFRHNVVDLLELPLSFYGAVPQPTMVTLYHRMDPFALVTATHGRMDYPLHAISLEESCKLKADALNRTSTLKMDQLVAKYGKHTQTLVYVAPVPGCAGAQVLAQRVYRGGLTAPPVVLPPRYFASDYSHILMVGARTSSDLFLQAVRRALAQSAGQNDLPGQGSAGKGMAEGKKSRMPAMPAAPAS